MKLEFETTESGLVRVRLIQTREITSHIGNLAAVGRDKEDAIGLLHLKVLDRLEACKVAVYFLEREIGNDSPGTTEGTRGPG